jgi:hypothetical protein
VQRNRQRRYRDAEAAARVAQLIKINMDLLRPIKISHEKPNVPREAT